MVEPTDALPFAVSEPPTVALPLAVRSALSTNDEADTLCKVVLPVTVKEVVTAALVREVDPLTDNELSDAGPLAENEVSDTGPLAVNEVSDAGPLAVNEVSVP